jgi:serpin B
MKAIILASAFIAMRTLAADTDPAARAINQLGLDLHRRLAKPGENLCLSPYSIQSALAMTYAGSAGKTRDEMAKVLHFPKDDPPLHAAFRALNGSLAQAVAKSAEVARDAKKWGGPSEPISLNIANRIFGQNGHGFKVPFTTLLKGVYGAPMEQLDFRASPERARAHINGWVEAQTKKRIRDLIPRGMLHEDSRLVLVNAVYLKAPWLVEFDEGRTKPAPFHIGGGTAKPVPTMNQQMNYGYVKRNGWQAITLPYSGSELHFLIIVPAEAGGLGAVEKSLDAATLSELAKLPVREVDLYLPKFKLEPSSVMLGGTLRELGMRTAFDVPEGSANFNGIAPRTPQEYLFISEVAHKTFLALDEKGTEAAAATAVAAAPAAALAEPPKVVEVKVDRPFLFAIQHAPSGACLFLGRVNDPTGK